MSVISVGVKEKKNSHGARVWDWKSTVDREYPEGDRLFQSDDL